jgi:hypothetical protein
VNNQLLTATVSPGGSASLGLTPDWPGAGYGGFTADPAVSNTVDPALRISPGYRLPGTQRNCRNFICRPGEVQWALTQWLNQGTDKLRLLRAVITAPNGSTITHVSPYYGYRADSGQAISGFFITNATSGQALPVTSTGALDHPATRIKIRLVGRLLPGTEYLTAVAYRVNDDAPFSDGNHDGQPDCNAATGTAYPGQTCERASDNSPGSYITYGSIIRTRPRADEDSSYCPSIPDDCLIFGVHNKTLGGDSNDSAAWQVDSTFPPNLP